MEIAAAVGTAFHGCIEEYLDTTEYHVRMDKYASCESRVRGMVESWIRWSLSIDGTIDHTEMKVISKKHIYSGTFDAVGKIGKKYMVIDWKTGSRIYPTMALQLSAYAEAYNEMTFERVENREIKQVEIKYGLIVHISKDRPHKVTTKEFKLGKRVFGKFLKLRAMFDEMRARSTIQAGGK
jgi:hypothetical protein